MAQETAIGLKCNDCGRRYAWNRNIDRRKSCEECGCTWLELWGSIVSAEEMAKWSKQRQRWAAENPIKDYGLPKMLAAGRDAHGKG